MGSIDIYRKNFSAIYFKAYDGAATEAEYELEWVVSETNGGGKEFRIIIINSKQIYFKNTKNRVKYKE